MYPIGQANVTLCPFTDTDELALGIDGCCGQLVPFRGIQADNVLVGNYMKLSLTGWVIYSKECGLRSPAINYATTTVR